MLPPQTARLLSSADGYPAAPRLPAFDPACLGRRRVDAHWLALENGEAVARASVWHRAGPTLAGGRVGVIGHYAAANPAAGAAVLARAVGELAAAGCVRAIGPMEGDTWHPYRFVTERGDAPAFFLEPAQPPEWPDCWRAAGFAELATYHSTVTDDLDAGADDPRQRAAERRARDAGLRLRPLDPARWDEELRGVYAVAAASFQSSFLYTPLPESEFAALYQPLRGLVRPELVRLAEDAAGQTVGFVLTLPDALDPAGGTCIVKTVAVRPEHAGSGLGRVLVGGAHAAARALGFRRVIHALMHDANPSRHLSARFGARVLRRYALFARPLP